MEKQKHMILCRQQNVSYSKKQVKTRFPLDMALKIKVVVLVYYSHQNPPLCNKQKALR